MRKEDEWVGERAFFSSVLRGVLCCIVLYCKKKDVFLRRGEKR